MTRASLFLAAAVSALLPACAESETADELAGESSADGEEGKGDSVAAFTFYNVFPDNRACSLNSPPDCGRGFFVSRANRSTTQCGRGVSSSMCKITEVDWTGTAMPESVAESYEERLREGEPLLVRGSLSPAANDAGLTLAVTEIWVTSNPEWVDGVFTMVKDNGIRCIVAPCPSLTERKLNSTLSAQISSLDLEMSGADADAIEWARSQLYTEEGLIIVGYRYYDGAGGKGRTANKFFTRAPVPLF